MFGICSKGTEFCSKSHFMQSSPIFSNKNLCHQPVNELLKDEKSRSFTPFARSTSKKMCAKTRSSVPFVMSQIDASLNPPGSWQHTQSGVHSAY